MLTYQDYLNHKGAQADFVKSAINNYISSDLYKTACVADLYDRQLNVTVNNYAKYIYSLKGEKKEDITASNNKIASNFFNRLNTQRNTYSLGNGINFSKPEIKNKFGDRFDTIMQAAGYAALIHGVSYLFISKRLYCFEATELVPLHDEYTGRLRAAIRFWRIADNKPLNAIFYEKDGYTEFQEDDGEKNNDRVLKVKKEKTSYIHKVSYTEAFGFELVGEENYSDLPIIPLFGSRLKQSTLIGLRTVIDSYDLIRSGFANDLDDCAQIYWILGNYGGMHEGDLAKFRNRLKFNHIAEANLNEGGSITPYTQDIPFQARTQYLATIRSEIYENFGGLDVHTIAAGATNDHIDAAYQPLDENADDFEKQIIECVQNIGAVLGIPEDDCVPIFKRNRISNQTEQTEMVLQAAQYLDDETVLRHLPFITVDEVTDILARKAAEEQDRYRNAESELDELRQAQAEQKTESKPQDESSAA